MTIEVNELDMRGATVIAAGWADDDSGCWRIAWRLPNDELVVRDYRYRVEFHGALAA